MLACRAVGRFLTVIACLGAVLAGALAAPGAALGHAFTAAAPAQFAVKPPVEGLAAARTPAGDLRLVNRGRAPIDVVTPGGATVSLRPVADGSAPAVTLPAAGPETRLTVRVDGRPLPVRVAAPRRLSSELTTVVFLAVPLLALIAGAAALARAIRPFHPSPARP